MIEDRAVLQGESFLGEKNGNQKETTQQREIIGSFVSALPTVSFLSRFS
jgi:hypothetical protein